MRSIAFIDIETDAAGKKILDIGAVANDGQTLHNPSISNLADFLKNADFICGHNIMQHDLKYIRHAVQTANTLPENVLDTLYWSPLLFPQKPYHALVKDDKLQTDSLNNPLNDAQKARDLFYSETAAFDRLDVELKAIFFHLLRDLPAFSAFFRYLQFRPADGSDPMGKIRQKFRSDICAEANLPRLAAQYPAELAYCLALIDCHDRYSVVPPWVLKNFPKTEWVMAALRNKPCLKGCLYCNQHLDIFKGLKDHFGFDNYRKYAGEPLQERAAQAAVENKSLLAIFPTGGGKSITFQVPALMQGQSMKGLTVVISPLQSLMKDQVDNLEKAGITDAVTINGLLDPIERTKSVERVADGSATLLYISPESLRSKTIEHLFLSRTVVRFVIDEAHCFSSWGQDFRVDYLYIADFIKNIQEKKNLQDAIPVSCFTATAKRKVVQDICAYFKEKLGIELEVFSSTASRENLRYSVFEKETKEEKYTALRDLVAAKNCPTIVYTSRTRTARELTDHLNADGFNACAFYGKMEPKDKAENQDAFIAGEVQIMVATSAFGMGVDKKDVGLVVHFDISDSLENYVQEAGRAGRDSGIQAECYILFHEEDLNKHFILLNQTKINLQEIGQIWNAIKLITKYRTSVSNSPLEIARRAGWDDTVSEIETRVTTAIAALEDAGYLKREQNMPRIFANSILSKTAQEAIEKIQNSARFASDQQRMNAIRIIKKLISSKSKQQTNDEAAEARIDYISDHLGIVKEAVIEIVNILRQEKILADMKDLTAFVKRGEHQNRSLATLEKFRQIEAFLFTQIDGTEQALSLKALNETAETAGCESASPSRIKTVLNFWAIKNWIKRRQKDFSNQIMVVMAVEPIERLQEKWERRHALARFIVERLYEKSKTAKAETAESDEVLVEFSVLELKEAFERQAGLFQINIQPADVEDALFYLSRMDALKIEGGFMVVYNRLSIIRLEQNNKVRYKAEDYLKLNQYYESRVQQIHIVGEYAKKMLDDYVGALRFVDDYFQLNQDSFLGKYFPGSRQTEIKRNITPAKYRQLFYELSDAQRAIIDDKNSPHLVIAAGPGSGKTKVLVHKLAALLLLEDVKHEQLLMLTFSRAAATEFKKRLAVLIGNAAHFVEIKTFHACCFDLLGRVGTLEKSDKIVQAATEKIRNNEVEANRIAKTVLVIDEAQDMNADEFALVQALLDKNEDLRVIAVGDDDQNIYAFRGSDYIYMLQLIEKHQAVPYELITNFRSRSNLVAFSNAFAKTMTTRLKTRDIEPHRHEQGNLSVVKYQSTNLVQPLVNDLLAKDLTGTVCVLTQTNEEAAQVAGLLLERGRRAKLIQTNDGFPLQNLLEVRFFIDALQTEGAAVVIAPETWEHAKRAVRQEFASSPILEIVLNLAQDFQETNSKILYWTDFQVFVRESKIEDFFRHDSETIVVSTIHKAKGKEFDHVFLLLARGSALSEEDKRKIYVALTRAKDHLAVHTNSSIFDHLSVPQLSRLENAEAWEPPLRITVLLSLRDVDLGYFTFVQHRIIKLVTGQGLQITTEGVANEQGEKVAKFSKKFQYDINQYHKSGYELSAAQINFIVFWKKQEDNMEYRVVLPKLILQRRDT